MRKFYITTTTPYVNAKPHIGFAMEIIRADAVARAHALLGNEVFFNTGTDEHGQKIYDEARAAGQAPQEYVDEWAAKFDKLKEYLNLSYNNFIRTTDRHHLSAAQEFWRRCNANGDIYKKNYQIKYCIGCELPKTDSELVDGKCPLHANRELEIREEENYFFRFSKYQDQLLKLYEERPDFIVPSFRLGEMKTFARGGLTDFSISRLKSKMPWGVDVPNDPEQVMYVWFDALVNYISALGWPEDEEKFNSFWPGVQIAGKDNLRQQTAMWQAMLMSAGLSPSRQVFVEGFVTGEGGIKMSKSLGNVIDPIEYVERYGTDAVRYYVLAKFSSYEDSPISQKLFEEAYNSDLANGIGNLVARVATMAENTNLRIYESKNIRIGDEVIRAMESWDFNGAMEYIWGQIKQADTLINEREVWKLEGVEKEKMLIDLVNRLRQIGTDLAPFLPETAEKILKTFAGPEIKKSEILFPRL
ncbi:methionine--tRNA ligase [Candidatus Collierbacteria bacterium]|nr:methionine--tRNA ligase [Candidatus Collierbacteria bacterium]